MPFQRQTDEFLELWPLTKKEAFYFTAFLVNCGACGLVWKKTGELFIWRGTKCPNCGAHDGNARWVTSIVNEEWIELSEKQKARAANPGLKTK